MSTAALVLVQVVSLGQTLVLARLLTPAEVGLYAAGSGLALFLVVFAEGALTQALIQRGDDDLDDAADTVFWATAAGGLVMSLLALACAALIGLVFESPTAGAVAAAISGTMVIHSFTNVPDALMQRRLDFRRRLVIDPLNAIAFAAVSVTFAALGFGVWSMVIGSYAQMLTWLAASWTLGGWRPGRGRVSIRLWRELAGFGFPLLVGTLLERVRELLELVIVGRALDAAALGYYRYGKRIAQLPGMVVVQAGAFVLFPAFARIAGDAERLRQAFLRALTWLWVAALPAGGILVACGESLAVLLLGERWRGAGVALTAMAGYGIGQALTAVTGEVLKGAGRSRKLYGPSIVGLVSGIGLLLLLLPLGLTGVGLAVSGAAVLVGLTGLWAARAVVGVSVRELVARLLPPAIAGVLATAGVTWAERVLVRADALPVVPGLAAVLVESVVLVVAYLVLLRVLAPWLVRPAFRALRRTEPGRH